MITVPYEFTAWHDIEEYLNENVGPASPVETIPNTFVKLGVLHSKTTVEQGKDGQPYWAMRIQNKNIRLTVLPAEHELFLALKYGIAQ